MVTMLFLYLIVLFTFYACKNDTNNISNWQKTKKNIDIYKSLGKNKDLYIYKHHANFQDSIGTQSRALGFYIRVPGEIKRSRDLRGGRWSWAKKAGLLLL